MSFKDIQASQFSPPKFRNGFNFSNGWRNIGDKRIFARSRWEANYARYLQLLKERGEIKEWFHEPKTFWFNGIRRGVTNYKPDFQVIQPDGNEVWIEVKGWMQAKDKTKLKRMKLYHPQIKMRLVDGKWFKRNETFCLRNIKEWER